MSVYLVVLLVIAAVIARDAWNDLTPRKPFDWRRPELEWWAQKVTRRERARGAIAMGSEKSS